MATNYPLKKMRLGFIGSGFIGHFHLKAMIGVRNVEVNGVYSPTPANREKLALAVIDAELGDCKAHESLESLLQAPDIDALWILSPN
jgi:predicted dehydrogenase